MILNRRHFCIPTVCLLAAVFAGNPADAQTRVGEAVVVKNEVVRVAGPATTQINVGDGVIRNETVRTGLDSAARLVLADSTNLSLGPNATLKLDRTVFNDEQTYREIAIRLTAGAFRFVTGNSPKTAYKITTALATIGVRGTELDFKLQPTMHMVVLQHGEAQVCKNLRRAQPPNRQVGPLDGECIELTQPGDTAIITATGGNVRIQKTNNPPWTFAGNCGAAAGLCTPTQYADATPGGDPGGALCGR
jgi:ferric-dicitrate binding protein FerR (iron transport regulator)